MLKYHKYYLALPVAFLLFFSSFNLSLAARSFDGFGEGGGYTTPAYNTPAYQYPDPAPQQGPGGTFNPGSDGSNDSSTWNIIERVRRILRAARASTLNANNPAISTSNLFNCVWGGGSNCLSGLLPGLNNLIIPFTQSLQSGSVINPRPMPASGTFGNTGGLVSYSACTTTRTSESSCNTCCSFNHYFSQSDLSSCNTACHNTFDSPTTRNPVTQGTTCDSALMYACSSQGKMCVGGSCVSPSELSFSDNFDMINGEPVIRICLGDRLNTCQWHNLEDLPQYFAENNLELTETFLTNNTGRLNDIWHSYCVQNPNNTDVCGDNHDITSSIRPNDLNSREFNTLVEFYLYTWASNPASIINEYLEITQLKDDPVARQILTTYLSNGGNDITGGSIEGFEVAYAMETGCNETFNSSTLCNIVQLAQIYSIPVGIITPYAGVALNAGTSFYTAYNQTKTCETAYGPGHPNCEGFYIAAAESLALDAILQKLGGHAPINSVDVPIERLITPELFARAAFRNLNPEEQRLLLDLAGELLNDDGYILALRNASSNANQNSSRQVVQGNNNINPEWVSSNQWSNQPARELSEPFLHQFENTSEEALVMTSARYNRNIDDAETYIINLKRPPSSDPDADFISEMVEGNMFTQFIRQTADPNSIVVQTSNIADAVEIARQLKEEGSNVVFSITAHGGYDRLLFEYSNPNIGISSSSLSGNQLGRILTHEGLPTDMPVVMVSCHNGACSLNKESLILTLSDTIPNPIYGPNGAIIYNTIDGNVTSEAAIGLFEGQQYVPPANRNDLWRVAQNGEMYTMYGQLPPGFSDMRIIYPNQ